MTQKPSQPPNLIFRLGAIATILVTLTAAFAYVSGWAAPQRLTPDRVVSAFEAISGVHEGVRRNHAKGVCVIGEFSSNGNAATLSRASVFEEGRQVPVIGRLAVPGPNPEVADAKPPVRSFALRFSLPEGEEWRTAMNAMPVFSVSTPEAFYAQLEASMPAPETGRPDPQKMASFLAEHPETQAFRDWAKTAERSSSYANITYNSLNAFRFIDGQGNTRFVRWSLVPEASFEPIRDDQLQNPDFLYSELQERLEERSLRWQLFVTIADPGDPTDDATRQWPDSRKQINAGTLIITHMQDQENGACRDINYDPLILPKGIEGSDDPLLSARSAVYAESFNRRTREQAGYSHDKISKSDDGQEMEP